ncbi:hypothetical protein [Aquipuribacter sp. SD81]|uniref:hypothetical protein n=1 Tax=Aquipuribacter sp. SD81 TaxID=3127703 RepID=UPI00301B25A6
MKTAVLTFATALVAAGGIALAGPASAAHCIDADGTSPGFSWFGVHARTVDHAEGGNPGPHAGTSGASNCLETTGSPSDRAPGRG